MRTITARHGGQCRQCGQPIAPGARIALAGRVWAHEPCAEQYARDVAADDLDALTYGGRG